MKLLVAIVLVMDMMAVYVVASGQPVAWINDAKKTKCTNPFFTKGLTVFLEGKSYEIGFRDDGLMVWRHNPEK